MENGLRRCFSGCGCSGAHVSPILGGLFRGQSARIFPRMTRAEFEVLLRSPGKRISESVSLRPDPSQPQKLVAQAIIRNGDGREAVIHIRFDTRTLSKTINVVVSGVGPICRLDVDGARHRTEGRNHKHDLRTPRCPERNLPEAVARPELSGQSIEDVFNAFCAESGIRNAGVTTRRGQS